MLQPLYSRSSSDGLPAGSPATVVAECPSCHQVTRFTFIGLQRWPRKVAETMGTDEVTRLYKCGHCQTTISNIDEQAEPE